MKRCQRQEHAKAPNTHLYVLVLSWQRLDHLFHGSGQIFGVLFDGKFGISEAQHAAAASSDIEQSALLGALDLQLQILLGDLVHGVRM